MCKILIVEGDEQQRCHYSEELVKEGHKVIAVNQNEQALSLLEYTPIDLVVMNLAQPEGKGLNNLQEIVKRHREVKVIIHSASPLFMLDFRSWAADRLLSNALDISELKETINELTASVGWQNREQSTDSSTKEKRIQERIQECNAPFVCLTGRKKRNHR